MHRIPLFVALAAAGIVAGAALVAPAPVHAAQQRPGPATTQAATPAARPADTCADTAATPRARVDACRARVRRAGADADAREAYGRALLRVERYKDARAELERAVALAPGRITAWEALSDAFFVDEDLKESHEGGHRVLDRMVAANPDSVAARVLAARAHLADEEWEPALAHLDHALRVAPRDPDLHDLRGDALHGLDRQDDALAAYAAAVAIDSTHRNGHLGVAMILMERERPAEALPHYDAVLAREPEARWLVRRKADALVQLERADEGVATMRAVVARAPADDEAHYELGSFLLELGRPAEAEPALREAVRLDTADAGNRNDLGIALLRQGKVDDAIASFREAVRLAPKFRLARVNLFDALLGAQQLDQALALVEEWAKTAEPGDVDPWAARGAVLRAMGRPEEAVAALDQALARDSVNVSALVNRGVSLVLLERWDAASADAAKLIRLQPELFNGHAIAGFAALGQERCEDVVMHWGEAQRLSPQWVEQNEQVKSAFESCIHRLGQKK